MVQLLLVWFLTLFLNLSAGHGVDPAGNVHWHPRLPLYVDANSLIRFDHEWMVHPNASAPVIKLAVAILVNQEINQHYPTYDAPPPAPKPIWNPGPCVLNHANMQIKSGPAKCWKKSVKRMQPGLTNLA